MIDGLNGFDLSASGEKMRLRQGTRWTIASTLQPLRSGEGILSLGEFEVRVDPKAEWRQMFYEAWRLQRDFFYDPGLDGLDLRQRSKNMNLSSIVLRIAPI